MLVETLVARRVPGAPMSSGQRAELAPVHVEPSSRSVYADPTFMLITLMMIKRAG